MFLIGWWFRCQNDDTYRQSTRITNELLEYQCSSYQISDPKSIQIQNQVSCNSPHIARLNAIRSYNDTRGHVLFLGIKSGQSGPFMSILSPLYLFSPIFPLLCLSSSATYDSICKCGIFLHSLHTNFFFFLPCLCAKKWSKTKGRRY